MKSRETIIINLRGLNSYSSHRLTENNYLLDCNNIICDQGGIIATRRGFSFFNDVLSACTKIFSAIGYLFVVANSTMYYDNSGTFAAVTFPTTTSFNSNSVTEKIQIEDQNKSLFFNGKRVSSETSSPVDKKIKKLTSKSSNVINAGLEAPINLLIVTNSTGGGFADDATFAVRVFYQYTDINNFLITSSVSDRVIALNESGSAQSFTMTYQIPNQYIDRPVDIYYAISNVVISPVSPDDNLFWGKNTLMQSGVMINAGLSSVFSFGNFITRDNILNPVDLYTNSQQEGILQNNEPPICAVDIETYHNYTFYGNLIDRLQKRVQAITFPLSTNIITLDGISYQRAATSDYSASPVLFSGNSIYEYTLDLIRAITATQTKYRAIYEQDNISVLERWVIKQTDPFTTLVTPATLYGNKIYIFPGSNDISGTAYDNLIIYNTVTDVWEVGEHSPQAVFDNNFENVNGILFSLCGLTAASNPGETQIYFTNTNTWITGTIKPGVDPLYLSSSCVVGNNIFLIGGRGLFNALDTNLVYDTNSDIWSSTTNLPVARYCGAAIAVGSDIYYFGGYDAANDSKNNAYVLISGVWSAIANLPQTMGRMGITYFDGNIYLINGQTGNFSGGAALSVVYKYNILSNSYSSIASTNYSRYGNAAKFVNNAIYTVGGSSPQTEKYQIDGLYFQLQERFIGEETDISYTSSGYVTNANFDGTSSPLFRFNQKNTIQFSKQGQPEAVPFFNNFQTGSATYDILRLSALRSSLMILKTDGIYQLNGVSPETFSVQQLDPTFILIASQSVAKLNNEIYCLTNKGIVTINESGANIISYPIKDLIDADIAAVGAANLNTAINGTAYEDDYKYILTINNHTYTYNYISEQWTIWFSGISNIKSWTVFNSFLYYLDTTRAYKERKTLTSSDYQDENGDGINAMVQFNNLELSPGSLTNIISMQILQRLISNLTISITPENSFNTGVLFNQALAKYVERVQFGNGNRMAFYFRPKFEWNTEIVATPDTFANLQLEGIEFETQVTRSNLS